MQATIIGLGLIGGSLALELRNSNRFNRITGVDENAAHAGLAVELGLADEVLPLDKSIAHSRLIVLAVPVNAITRLLPRVLY